MKQCPARGGMHEADEVAPFVAVLHWRKRSLPLGRPGPPQDRFEPNAMFVDGPQLHLSVGKGGGHLAHERAELCLKRAWAAGSAWTWR